MPAPEIRRRDRFDFLGMPTRVIFGRGRLSELGEEVGRLERSRAFVVATSGRAGVLDRVTASLGDRFAGAFTEAAMHTPVDVTERALAVFAVSRADLVVAIGGGSAIGLSKAIALRTGVDQIAIPTTYAGSEMTDVLGETKAGAKTTRRDPAILPETVIYDVNLTLSLPAAISVTSGLNALAHAAEGLYAVDRNPLITLMATEAIGAFARALPAIVREPSGVEGRLAAQYGAWLCGAVLGGSSMALHHKLCHVLGGSFGLPHAETHTVLLPHTVGFNAVTAAAELAPVTSILGGTGPGTALFDFARGLGAPMRLRDLGLAASDLDRAAELAVRAPYANPRPFDRADIRALLGQAWEGVRPPQ